MKIKKRKASIQEPVKFSYFVGPLSISRQEAVEVVRGRGPLRVVYCEPHTGEVRRLLSAKFLILDDGRAGVLKKYDNAPADFIHLSARSFFSIQNRFKSVDLPYDLGPMTFQSCRGH